VTLVVLWIAFVVTTLVAYDGPPTAPPTPAPELARAV
jgi:hypothetical protein